MIEDSFLLFLKLQSLLSRHTLHLILVQLLDKQSIFLHQLIQIRLDFLQLGPHLV